MRRIFLALAFMLGLLTQAYAVTVYYQPTPYPLKKWNDAPANPKPMPQDINIVHVWDGWLTSYTGVNTWIGTDILSTYAATFDTRKIYLKFDLTGLPTDPTYAALWLMPSNTSSPAPYIDVWRIDNSWDKSTITWSNQPGATKLGWLPPAQTGVWWGQNITTQYQQWKSGATPNNGLRFEIYWPGAYWTEFRSSRYADFTSDPVADGKRPYLELQFTPTLQLKMPLPAGYSWLLTNEAGGYECTGHDPWPDVYHQDATNNYFSLDFSWRNKPMSGQGPSPYGQNNTPILAAAGGKVIESGFNSSNGYYVVIDHDSDGVATTGFQTRYLHMQTNPAVVVGNTVTQGQLLGYMGNSGISTGVHLHFGVRYQNHGASTVPELTKVTLEGKILKSYQTECSVDSAGKPTDWIRYYQSY